MASQSEMNVITKSRNDCPVVEVTVYKDRAQVSRTLEVELKEGIQELHITDFVEIEEDSIRVEGKGNATIAEVSFQSEVGKEDNVTLQGKEKALQEELKLLKEEMENLKIPSKKDVLTKEKKLLDDFFNKAARSGIAPENPEGSGNVELTGSYLRGVQEYITEYRTMNYALIADMQELEKKEAELKKATEVIEAKLRDVRGGRRPTDRKRECIIVLESPKESKIELTVSYVVFSASWIPSYDLRMFTDKGNLKLFYYGLISQSSGEDWNDTKIFLSTAEPSFGGNIPRIPITHLSVYEPPSYSMPKRGALLGASLRKKSRSVPQSEFQLCSIGTESLMMGGGLDESMQRNMDVTEVKVVDKTTSTSYEIARNSTIPSDNNPHKVTVAILDYEPELSYVTVPKASPNAFLRAKVVNTSSFMLLAGESSIFLDNSFISKAQLQSAAPKEEFTCSLGVDPSVRVTYKPIIKMKSSSGLLTKSESNLYEQVIVVKNLHEYSVKVLVQDSLPKSTRDKIKVNLISPAIDPKHPEKATDVRMNAYNVVEWDLNIDSMATKEVVLKYSVEHPANIKVESTASFATQSD